MILTLHNSLLNKRVIERTDIFNAQDTLVGNTPEDDFKKVKKSLSRESIYIHDYIGENDNDEEKSEGKTIFDSFAGLTDKYKL